MQHIVFLICMIPVMSLIFIAFIDMFKKKPGLDLREWEKRKHIPKCNENQSSVEINTNVKL